MSQPWNTGFCGCTEDVKLCLVGLCCSCYIHGLNNEQLNGESVGKSCVLYCLTALCQCAHLKPHREGFRKKYDLIEKPNDLVATCGCCAPLAVLQERRELNQRLGVKGPTSKQPR